VSYAIDRGRLADLFGLATPTCQIVPSNTAGYRPYCPFTVNAGSGAWTAPDLTRAKRLLRSAHVQGEHVTVWELVVDLLPSTVPMASYLETLFSELGFRVSHHVFRDFPAFFDAVSDSRNRPQTFIYGWTADYPAASNFLDHLFSCDAFIPDSADNVNEAEFCDPSIDRIMDRALQLQFTDPRAAGDEWAKADRAIVDEAPWAALFNPAGIDLVSRRVRNYQHNPLFGLLIDQLWVR
jgi:peptide/nickel transport system substrate-binding protein